jgi:hypothetical protein
MRKPRSSFKLQDVQRAVNSQKFRATGQFPGDPRLIRHQVDSFELRHTPDAVGAVS